MNESMLTLKERYQAKLYWQLMAKLPQPGGVHIYSTGRTVSQTFQMNSVIIIGAGVDYAQAELGYDKNFNPLDPGDSYLRGINYEILRTCTKSVAESMVIPLGGKVDCEI